MTFRVGQEVECVNAEPADDWHVLWLAKGNIYIVTGLVGGFGSFNYGPGRSEYGVTLAGLECKPNGFGASRFRPIVKRKTSIEVFTRLLVPGSKVSEPV